MHELSDWIMSLVMNLKFATLLIPRCQRHWAKQELVNIIPPMGFIVHCFWPFAYVCLHEFERQRAVILLKGLASIENAFVPCNPTTINLGSVLGMLFCDASLGSRTLGTCSGWPGIPEKGILEKQPQKDRRKSRLRDDGISLLARCLPTSGAWPATESGLRCCQICVLTSYPSAPSKLLVMLCIAKPSPL
eukprot:6483976-Amphidinium_carterae.3